MTIDEPHLSSDGTHLLVDEPRLTIDDIQPMIDEAHLTIDEPHLMIDEARLSIDGTHLLINEPYLLKVANGDQHYSLARIARLMAIIRPLADGEQQIIASLFDAFSVGTFVAIATHGFTIGYNIRRFQRP